MYSFTKSEFTFLPLRFSSNFKKEAFIPFLDSIQPNVRMAYPNTAKNTFPTPTLGIIKLLFQFFPDLELMNPHWLVLFTSLNEKINK